MLSVLSTPRRLADQSRFLKAALDPCVTAFAPIFAIPGIKVLCTPTFVALPVTLNHFHDFIDGSSPMGGLAKPLVSQSFQTALLVTIHQTTKGPLTHTKHSRRFFLRQSPLLPNTIQLLENHLPDLL
jgi:hypothetical protein